MNNSPRSKNSFRKIKINILIKVAAIMLGSIVLGIILLEVFIDGIFQDSFASYMVSMFTFLGFSFDQANSLYFHIFMNNKNLWLLIGLLIVLGIAFYFTFTRFTKYFDEISGGVDRLLDEDNRDIKLSRELDFMEDKLNEVKFELKKRDQDAKEAEKRKNELVVYLAHDIKTPLTTIIGYLNLLNESPEMPLESRAKYYDITLEKAYRLEELINEFFEITRFNLQSIKLEKARVDIGLMLMQIADEFYLQIEEKKLNTIMNIENDLVIQADSQKFARVINNVVKNAILYSHKGKPIEISARQQDDNVLIKITNFGDMIPRDKLDVIFEKFYRLDDARSTNKGGSGLGLAIAKEIVAAHGGEIHASSNENQTTFSISIPK